MQYQALERKKKIAKELLLKGYNEMIKCLQPETIIIYAINTTTAERNLCRNLICAKLDVDVIIWYTLSTEI